MTLSTTASRISYNGDGATVAFSFPYLFYADGDLTVISVSSAGVETVKTITTHYTVAGADNPAGGTVTMLTAPASGTKLLILREADYTQEVDLVNNDPLLAETLEEALDLKVMLSQQLKEIADRSLRFPRGDSTALTSELPTAATRASKYLGFDSSGNVSTVDSLGTWMGTWATTTVYAVGDIVKDGAAGANTTNIYRCATAHTSGTWATDLAAVKWVLMVDVASVAVSSAAAVAAQAAAELAQAAAELAETNAETAETNAETAETNAETAETNAAASAVAAAASALAAATAKTNAETAETNAETAETNAELAETNAETAQAAAEAAALSIALRWTFDSSTVMADPGTGDLRLNNATVASATEIAVSALSADTGNPDVSAFIATWDNSTNTTGKGTITIRKNGTPATFAVFSVTGAVTDNGTWLQVGVTYVDGAGTLSNADVLSTAFTRTGDKGADGAGGDLLSTNNLSDVANAATAATNLGLGTGDSPQFTALNVGHASDTTITRTGAGDIAVEGNAIYRAGGTNVAIADGGTGADTLAGAGIAQLGASQAFTAAQGCTNYAMTDGATITPDMAAQNQGSVLLGGDRTLGFPTGLVAGKRQSFHYDLWQDNTGTRTFAYAWCYKWAGGTAGTLSTVAGTRDKLTGDVVVYNTGTVTMTIATPCVVTWTSHGLLAGTHVTVQLTTTGALPTGLSASTTYWASVVDANTINLSTSLANAVAGTYIATSGSQSGTHTIIACAIDLVLNKAFS